MRLRGESGVAGLLGSGAGSTATGRGTVGVLEGTCLAWVTAGDGDIGVGYVQNLAM